jgi:hypothetical protein
MPEIADTLQLLVDRGTKQGASLNHQLNKIKRQVEESGAAQAKRTMAALKSIPSSITVRFDVTPSEEEEDEDLAQPQRILKAVGATPGLMTPASTTPVPMTPASATLGLTTPGSTMLAPPLAPLLEPPAYEMSRKCHTVAQVYTEWMVGFSPGPSIKELDRLYGPRWRSGRHKESQFYSLRRDLINEIQRIAKRNNTSEEIAIVDLQRRQTAHGWSINQLCKEIRKEASARGEGVKQRKRKRNDHA